MVGSGHATRNHAREILIGVGRRFPVSLRRVIKSDRMRTYFICARWFGLLAAVAWVAPSAQAGLEIQFDYRYDSRGFFSGLNMGRRQVLEAAASAIEARIASTPPAIRPAGINTWTLSFLNPNNGSNVSLRDLNVPAGVMMVFVGARQLSGGFIGYSEYNYTYFGDSSWVQLFDGKDNADGFSPFGGAIAFDVDTPWYFDSTPETLEPFPGEYDFYSLALHELGHLLGITAGARAFEALSDSGEFYGNQAQAAFGGPVPLSPDGNHWRQDVTYAGTTASMAPTFFFGQRRPFSELDFAALADIGYVLRPPIEPLLMIGVVVEGSQVTVTWQGGAPPFELQTSPDMSDGSWKTVGSITNERSQTVEATTATGFFRVEEVP